MQQRQDTRPIRELHGNKRVLVSFKLGAFSVIERERERERRERERGREGERETCASRDRVVSIWLASCTNRHKELFVPQEAGGESSPLRRDSGELKDSLSV